MSRTPSESIVGTRTTARGAGLPLTTGTCPFSRHTAIVPSKSEADLAIGTRTTAEGLGCMTPQQSQLVKSSEGT
jgi:hypothetical protein